MDPTAASHLTAAPSPSLDCPVEPDNDDTVGSMIQWIHQSGLSPSTDKLHLTAGTSAGCCCRIMSTSTGSVTFKVAELVEAGCRPTVHT